jgi:hypothetical protein
MCSQNSPLPYYKYARSLVLFANTISICANPNKRKFDENSILLILNKDRAASFIHFG